MIASNDRLLRREEVSARCSMSRSMVYRLMREGDFPEPIKIGERAVRWLESEVERWIASRPRAKGQSGVSSRRRRSSKRRSLGAGMRRRYQLRLKRGKVDGRTNRRLKGQAKAVPRRRSRSGPTDA